MYIFQFFVKYFVSRCLNLFRVCVEQSMWKTPVLSLNKSRLHDMNTSSTNHIFPHITLDDTVCSVRMDGIYTAKIMYVLKYLPLHQQRGFFKAVPARSYRTRQWWYELEQQIHTQLFTGMLRQLQTSFKTFKVDFHFILTRPETVKTGNQSKILMFALENGEE